MGHFRIFVLIENYVEFIGYSAKLNLTAFLSSRSFYAAICFCLSYTGDILSNKGFIRNFPRKIAVYYAYKEYKLNNMIAHVLYSP